MAAKFYIYRNLHVKGHFSIRYKGKVIYHCDSMMAENVEFKVNQKGKQKAIEGGVRNVHAFAVCDVAPEAGIWHKHAGMGWWRKITYNPFSEAGFYWDDDKTEVKGKVNTVWFVNGEVYGR